MPILRLSDITPVPTRWLWPGWLAAGHLHVLDGDPGVGKSMLTGDLAARLTTARPWPDGSPADPTPTSVILLNAEDAAAGATHARLAAAGADMTRIHVWSPAPNEPILRFPGGIDPLRDAIAAHRPRLVVIDPITAFLDRSVAFNNDPDVRRALQPLGALAEEFGCAVLLVRHLSKQIGSKSLYRGLGSIAFVAACRIAWLAAVDPIDAGRVVLAVNKNNLAEPADSLTYAVRPRDDDAKSPNAPLATIDVTGDYRSLPNSPIVWLGASSFAAAELGSPVTRLTRARLRARQLVLDLLRDGPRTSAEVRAAAAAERIHLKTVRRAAKDLDVEFRKIGCFRQQTTYWLLPGQRIPAAAIEPGSVDEWLESVG